MPQIITYSHKFSSSRMICPCCLGEEFDVAVTGTKRIKPNEECDNGDTSYDDGSPCECLCCGVKMPVSAFIYEGDEDILDITVIGLRPDITFKVNTQHKGRRKRYTTTVERFNGSVPTTIADVYTGSQENAKWEHEELEHIFHNIPERAHAAQENVRKVLEVDNDFTILPDEREINSLGYNWKKWQRWDGHDDIGPALDENLVNLFRRSPDAKGWLIAEAHKVDWKHTGGPEDVLYYREVKYGG